MADSPRILIFDSGVGGLSIAEVVKQQLPHSSIFYASDHAGFPYGLKAVDSLIDRVDSILKRLQALTSADIIVIACNTASTVVLPRIRGHFELPIVGVVPAIKPAANLSESKVIGLLATEGTVNRHYTQNLIQQYANGCEVVRLGSGELVQLAEAKLRGETIDTNHIEAIVRPLSSHPTIDTLVLGCTHFPFLKQELQQCLPNIKHWVDSGEAIARRTHYWLDELDLDNTQATEQTFTSYFIVEHANKIPDDIKMLEVYLTKAGFSGTQLVQL